MHIDIKQNGCLGREIQQPKLQSATVLWSVFEAKIRADGGAKETGDDQGMSMTFP